MNYGRQIMLKVMEIIPICLGQEYRITDKIIERCFPNGVYTTSALDFLLAFNEETSVARTQNDHILRNVIASLGFIEWLIPIFIAYNGNSKKVIKGFEKSADILFSINDLNEVSGVLPHGLFQTFVVLDAFTQVVNSGIRYEEVFDMIVDFQYSKFYTGAKGVLYRNAQNG